MVKEFFDQPNNQESEVKKVFDNIQGKNIPNMKKEKIQKRKEEALQMIDIMREHHLLKINPLGLNLVSLRDSLEQKIKELSSELENISNEQLQLQEEKEEEIRLKEADLRFVEHSIRARSDRQNLGKPLNMEDFENADKEPEE